MLDKVKLLYDFMAQLRNGPTKLYDPHIHIYRDQEHEIGLITYIISRDNDTLAICLVKANAVHNLGAVIHDGDDLQ